MKKLVVFAAALGLFVSAPTSAQNNDHHGDKNDATASHAGRGAPSGNTNQNGNGRNNGGDSHAKTFDAHQNVNRGAAVGVAHPMSGMTHTATPAANMHANQYLPKSGDVHPTAPVRATAGRSRGNTGWTGNAAAGHSAVNTQQANRAWSGNGGGGNVNVNSLRRNIQSPQHYSAGIYRAPQNYRSRRWGYGEQLPRGYFIRDYWISNFLIYGLFEPPSDLVWVRVGDDALLIDRYSGDIVQVRYGVFY